MTEMDPAEYEALETLEGAERAMDTEAELDVAPDDEAFPTADEEYSHGAIEELADVEGFHQPNDVLAEEPTWDE